MKIKKFTVVELIVVIAIIGMLMTLLLPSLQRAREAGMSAVCMSKLGQCGRAMNMYAKHNNLYLPGITGGGDYTDEGVLKKGGDTSEWKICLMPYLGLKAKENNKNSEVFSCPMSKLADLEEPKIWGKYAGGLALSRDLGKVYYSTVGSSLTSVNQPLVKIPQIEIPSETVAMGDTIDDPTNTKQVKCISRPSWSPNDITVANRHRKGMNVLWTDASVSWKSQNTLRAGKNNLMDYYYLILKQ